MGPRLPGLTTAAQYSWKNTGMLPGVADCGRSHAMLGPRDFGCSLLSRGLGSRRDLAGKKRGERTLAGGP